jgi:hypothetical protein
MNENTIVKSLLRLYLYRAACVIRSGTLLFRHLRSDIEGQRRDEMAGSPYVKIGCIENTVPCCGLTVGWCNGAAVYRCPVVCCCTMLYCAHYRYRQEAELWRPQDMGGWTFLLFFNKGDGAFSGPCTFINGSRMQYTRGARPQCLGTDKTRPDHLSKTAEADEGIE